MHHRIERLLRDTGTAYQEVRHADFPQPIQSPVDVAKALDCDLNQITKTLFMKTDEFLCVVLPAGQRADFQKIAAIRGKRPTMASSAELAEVLDYPPLSVSPLACGPAAVILDSTLAGQEWVLIGSGELGAELKISWRDLVALTKGKAVDISR